MVDEVANCKDYATSAEVIDNLKPRQLGQSPDNKVCWREADHGEEAEQDPIVPEPVLFSGLFFFLF